MWGLGALLLCSVGGAIVGRVTAGVESCLLRRGCGLVRDGSRGDVVHCRSRMVDVSSRGATANFYGVYLPVVAGSRSLNGAGLLGLYGTVASQRGIIGTFLVRSYVLLACRFG